MARMTMDEARTALRVAAEQRQWFDDHGGCLEAYERRYGAAHRPDGKDYGNGPEAIYSADRDALELAEADAVVARHVIKAKDERRGERRNL